MYRGIVVLDVDGVIFRNFFLGKLIRHISFKNYLKAVGLGVKYYKNKISTEVLLAKGYSMVEGISAYEAKMIANRIKRAKNIDKTIKILKEHGFFVSILSAGVPNFILKELSIELGANHYNGLEVNPKSENLGSEKITLISKEKIIGELINSLNLSWNDVISIGDDPYNLILFKKSHLSIGFNPSKVIREEASVIIEGNDLLEILPYILSSSELPKNLSREHFRWKKELFRKFIHIFGAGIPFLTKVIDKTQVLIALALIVVIYLISEILRHHGLSNPFISKITKRAQRSTETRNIIFGPVLLGIGIILTLLLFNYSIYTPSILVVSISDTLSTIVGSKIGRHQFRILKNSSLEGSLAFFFSSFIILFFFCPFYISLIGAFFSTLIEIIPIYNLDNIAIPLVTAVLLYFLNYIV